MEPSLPSRRQIVIVSVLVFVASVVIRVPSCYESFWLDELHTAWCVWGSLADVLPRADIGHQTPFYFVGIWFWKQLVGDSEVALRLSSVLAVALASSVISISVARWTKSLTAGAAAGSVLALENNSLFFGTELRPYALVLLFTSLALASFLAIRSVDASARLARHRSRLTLFLVLAGLTQPTALGVVAWLPLALLVSWIRSGRREDSSTKSGAALALLIAFIVALLLWQMTLGESWKQRTIWSNFATATHLGQIWEAWDWTWLMLVPLGVVFSVTFVTRSLSKPPVGRSILLTTLTLSGIAVCSTAVYWLAAFLEWVPIWHRRYFVAVLPILACVVGGSVGVIEARLSLTRGSRLCTVGVALALVMWPAYQAGFFASILNYPIALVSRGEDWRGAVARVRSLADPGREDVVLLDAGLIEARSWLESDDRAQTTQALQANLSTEQLAFLTFPVRGPYQIENRVIPIRSGIRRQAQPWESNGQRIFMIIRAAPSLVEQVADENRWNVQGFGNLSLLVERK